MIDYDEIRGKLAVAHNVLIAKDDPVLISVTLNEMVFDEYVNILLEKQTEHMQALVAAQQKGLTESKVTGATVINKAADYLNEVTGKGVKAAFDEGIERLKALEKKQEDSKSLPMLSQNAFWWGVICGCLPLALAIFVWF